MHATHSTAMGYILWILGFTGSHRFYFGKPISGIIWLFTGGLFLVGWLIDAFLIPGMERKATQRYSNGRFDYSAAWLLLTFLGLFGAHRFYLGKWPTGLLYLLSGGLFGVGVIYDFCTLNGQINTLNESSVNSDFLVVDVRNRE